MEILQRIVIALNEVFWEKNILVGVLLGAGVYFSYRTKFVQIRLLKETYGLLREKNGKDNKNISSFQAFCISTASRVGAGNLVGVVSAISIGGAGAIFWMWIVALLGASTAFIETTLALIYREKDSNGEYRGGPAFYLKNGLKMKKMGFLFVGAAIICWVGILQIVSNSVTESFKVAFFIDERVTTIILVVLSATVIFGKKDKTAKVLDKVVPIMSVLYIGVVLFILVKNFTLIPNVLGEIVTQAFGIRQGIGGAFGVIVMQGVKRGLLSNEAGSGSAPCAAAASSVDHPVKQGMIQSLGVFVDTLIICTATAMVILLTSPEVTNGLDGMELLQKAFTFHIGSLGDVFVAIVLFLFSFSTLLGICFYGKVNMYYITKKKWGENCFKVFALIMIFIGGLEKNTLMWSIADLGLALMTLINMVGIIPLCNVALDSLKDYESKKNK